MSSDITKERIERIRQYYTPNPDNKPCVRPSGDDFVALCDLALKAVTPPATAKLPEGVEVVRDMIDTFTERWYVKSGLYRLDQDDGLVWSKAAYNMFRTYDDALTAALAAPPVPGESKADYDKKCARCGRVPPVLDLVLCENCDRALTREIDEQAKDDRIAQLEAENAELKESLDGANSLLENHVCTPAEKPDPLARAVTVGEMLRLADLFEEKSFYKNHIATAARDAETIRSQAACIAELEAENARLRAQYDMVEQERTRLMLGQQVPYTPAEKPDARNFVATGEQRQDDYYEKPITEMKPDPRKVAPNGRAMARYELCGPNREYNMHGIDDEGHDWAWAHEGMWIEPFPACMDSRRTPCTFDGTPITETKPDPLARAVTVGEMLRLADNLKKGDLYFLCNHIRRVFTPPQGAAHAE